MSYYNELVGGGQNGHYYLLSSNTDWGQDTCYLLRWRKMHPTVQPLACFLADSFAQTLADSSDQESESETREQVALQSAAGLEEMRGLRAGDYVAVSVERLHEPGSRCERFLSSTPYARVGYSICIYLIEENEHLALEGAAE